MKKPKINFFRFLLIELKCFIFDWEVIVFIFAIISSLILFLKGCHLSELEKVLYGGIVSGFVFYFLIEFLPRTADKRKSLMRLAVEVQKCFEYLNSVFLDLEEEFSDLGIKMDETGRFFKLLQSQNREYSPRSKNLKFIKHTTNTIPIQFVFCNLGEALENKFLRLKEKLLHLDKIASIIQLESIDFDSMIEINQIVNRRQFYKTTPLVMRHTNNIWDNNAAIFGTDFDVIFDKLSVIKGRLHKIFNIEFH